MVATAEVKTVLPGADPHAGEERIRIEPGAATVRPATEGAG
jgi:hypothetical protein